MAGGVSMAAEDAEGPGPAPCGGQRAVTIDAQPVLALASRHPNGSLCHRPEDPMATPNPTAPANHLEIRSVHALLDEQFLVPSYQRGYRWTPVEVRALLDDLRDFVRLDTSRDAFYCLQPLVIRRDGARCEVVDGQQRLTTIRLLLHFLRELTGGKPYSLEYASRPGSQAALDAPETIDRAHNIDYFHIRQAWDAITGWFDEHRSRGDFTVRMEIATTLLAQDSVRPNVRVIWYELASNEHPIDMFTRLNRGKIPLTSAELIRAHLLNAKNFESLRDKTGSGELPPPPASFRPYEIAREWDAIEQDLQDDRYWHFLQGDSDPPAARIELLFDLIVRVAPGAPTTRDAGGLDERHRVFFAYQALTGTGKIAAGELWWQVKKVALRLREWFVDAKMYHLVGCLVWLASSAVDGRNADKRAAALDVLVRALHDANELPRAEVRANLRRRIREAIFGAGPSLAPLATVLGEYAYGEQRANDKIRAVLVAFNVATHLQVAERSRFFFPFDAFKKQTWDIEHIRATEDGFPARDYLQQAWLADLIQYLEFEHAADDEGTNEYLEEARLLKDAGRARLEMEFPAFYRKILAKYEGSSSSEGDGGNWMWNLTLLPSGINRSIGNRMFRIKRRQVLGRERDGEFVPVCTRNVFLKYYAPEVKNTLFWNATDRKSYLDAMVTTLDQFFTEEVA